ncbi:ribonucleoside-diphosphate reductase, adenosylcobalamin-dependent [Candidatus Pacearchaeota archaeon]|nr:ribonucleoside-diphosphate reductase, adenosylcobalamin-dependent [Candidatus Pacearchaeota archaeon]
MLIKDTGNLTDNALQVLNRRYLHRDEDGLPTESPIQMFKRVANSLASIEKKDERDSWAEKFFSVMWSLDFLPNSPTLMNAGTGQGTLSACYVLDIGDSMSSIMMTAHDQAMIEKFGGGVGFSLSGIRPKGTPIKTTQGRACGPIAVLQTLSQVGTMITQGGKRAGAHMAVISVYHPDILEFISCKAVEGDIDNFNISVGADSTFMTAVEDDNFLHLTWPLDTNSYDTLPLSTTGEGTWIKARELFDKITTGAWKNGEPGMVWLDHINQDNTTPHLGDINATNPCGEQPLLSGESCNLGSINLGNFVTDDKEFDLDRFKYTIKTCVHLLDNVIEVNNHPTEKTRQVNAQTRKIGLGVMGWADCLVRMDIPYDTQAALDLADQIGNALQVTADNYSNYLGKERGDFPAFAKSPLNKKNGGEWDHMRNAWRLSIAPTGTISMIADASSGIEPHFSLAFKKHNMSSQMQDIELFYVNKDLKKALNHDDLDAYLEKNGNITALLDEELVNLYRTSDVISPEWHVKMQIVWQKYVDSGISKTINLANTATLDDVYTAYMQAWSGNCKGITVYRQGSRAKEVLVSSDKSAPAPSEDKLSRPRSLSGSTTKMNTGQGTMYVTLNSDDDGDLYEVFATIGKAGGTAHANTEAICRLISLAMQYQIPTTEIINQLSGIQSTPVWDNGVLVQSIADGISKVLGESSDSTATSTTAMQSFTEGAVAAVSAVDECPVCSGPLNMSEGCEKCQACGYSQCG